MRQNNRFNSNRPEKRWFIRLFVKQSNRVEFFEMLAATCNINALIETGAPSTIVDCVGNGIGGYAVKRENLVGASDPSEFSEIEVTD